MENRYEFGKFGIQFFWKHVVNFFEEMKLFNPYDNITRFLDVLHQLFSILKSLKSKVDKFRKSK